MNFNYGGVTIINNSLGSYTSSKTSLNNTLISFGNSITDIITNPQINYTLIGIVARENPSKPSGYEVAEHVDGIVTLIIADTKTGSKQYIPRNLGPKKESEEEEEGPGINLVDYINNNYPDLEVLITGIRLKTATGKIRNEIAEPGTDVENVIEKYTSVSEKTETTNDNEVIEYDIKVNEDYVSSDQNPDGELDSEAELVATECESEVSESTE